MATEKVVKQTTPVLATGRLGVRRDKFSFWGAAELDIDNLPVTKEQAERSREILVRAGKLPPHQK